MHSLVVRVWVPDRPGSLAQVAAAIGSVGCDVTGIEILERGGGHAIDEIAVIAPHDSAREARDAILAGLRPLDGVAVEDIRERATDHVDIAVRALDVAVHIAASDGASLLPNLCDDLVSLLDGEWAVVMSDDGSEPIAAAGEVPDLGWLAAFVVGSRHLAASMEHTPSDVAWANLTGRGALVVVGRAAPPIHDRERSSVSALAAIADACLSGLRSVGSPVP